MSYDAAEIFRLKERIAKLERTVEFLLKHLHVEYRDNPENTIDPAILEALRRGNKIEAIKLYRAQTNLGLAEAKEFIDSLDI
jgi:ribosomal protein L7/L12